jgi:lipoyl(octanoyl) transferase
VTGTGKDCSVVFLGRIDYARALDLQMQICKAKKEGLVPDVLLLLEHPHSITLGRNGNWGNLLVSNEELSERGVKCFDSDRGGDITYHGPGQLVGYPVIQLEKGERDVHVYMRNLEESLIRLLALYNIEGSRVEGMTGVWAGAGKIASMGVHISRWVTRHGFALNVNTDLTFFRLIIPCGIVDRHMTSMNAILGRSLELPEIAERYVAEFGYAFNRCTEWISKSDFCRMLRQHAEVTPTE